MSAPSPSDPSASSVRARARVLVRSSSTWEVLGIVAFTAWIAWPFFAPGGYVTDYDTVSYSGPNLVATYRAWGAHQIPWWTSSVFGGTAFAGNPQTAVFYPLKVFFWPLGAATAFGAMTATHLFVLAFGMRHLVRRTLHLGPPAGVVAAVVMVGCGSTMVRTVRFEQIAVMAWIPWLLVTVDAVMVAQGGRRSAAVARCAVVVALVVLSGHPQLAYLGGALAGFWVVGRLIDLARAESGEDRDPTLHKVARLGVAVVLGAGIAALPLVAMRPLLAEQAVPPEAMLEEAHFDIYVLQPNRSVPELFGDPWRVPGALSAPSPEAPLFLGAASLTLALVGATITLARRRRSAYPTRATAATMLVAGVLSFVWAFGPSGVLYRWAYSFVPGFGYGRVPLRWLLITTFAVAVLAAMGVAALKDEVLSRRQSVVTAVSAVGVAIIVARGIAIAEGDASSTATRLAWLAAIATVIAGVLVAARRPDDRVVRTVLCLLAVGVVVLELGVPAGHSYGRLLRGSTSFVDSTSDPLRAFLAASGDRYLVVGSSDANTSLTTGARSLDGYDGGLWLTDSYVAGAQQLVDKPFVPMGRIADQIHLPVDADALARLGVRFVVVDPHESAARTLRRSPDAAEVEAARQRIVPGWSGPVLIDANREVWENPRYRGEAILHPTEAEADSVPALVRRTESGEIDVATNAASSGRLVLAEQAQAGWTATVDGRPVDLVRADGFALAVDVPAGAHDVRFRYRPPGLAVGSAVSLASLVAVVVLLVAGLRSRRARAAIGASTRPISGPDRDSHGT